MLGWQLIALLIAQQQSFEQLAEFELGDRSLLTILIADYDFTIVLDRQLLTNKDQVLVGDVVVLGKLVNKVQVVTQLV